MSLYLFFSGAFTPKNIVNFILKFFHFFLHFLDDRGASERIERSRAVYNWEQNLAVSSTGVSGGSPDSSLLGFVEGGVPCFPVVLGDSGSVGSGSSGVLEEHLLHQGHLLHGPHSSLVLNIAYGLLGVITLTFRLTSMINHDHRADLIGIRGGSPFGSDQHPAILVDLVLGGIQARARHHGKSCFLLGGIEVRADRSPDRFWCHGVESCDRKRSLKSG